MCAIIQSSPHVHGPLSRCLLHRQEGPQLLTENAEAVIRLGLTCVMANDRGRRVLVSGWRFVLTLHDAPTELEAATRLPHDRATGATVWAACSSCRGAAAVRAANNGRTAACRSDAATSRNAAVARAAAIIRVPLSVPRLAGIMVVPVSLIEGDNGQSDHRNERR